MSNFSEYNEQVKSEARFKLAVCYGHIVENPSITTSKLAKLMYTTSQTIDHWVVNLIDYLDVKKVKENNRLVRGFTAINTDKFNWGEIYRNSDDPRRTYFMDKFKELPEHLREAIFIGKISSDIVRVYNEGDLDHCDTPRKLKKSEYGIPSIMGEL